MKKILICLFVVIPFLSGCASRRPVVTGTDRIVRDSVRVETVYRDTTLYVPADSSMIQALIECDSTGRAYLKELLDYKAGEHLKPPSLNLTGNVLTASAQIDSFAVFAKLKDRYTEKNSQETRITTQTIETNVLNGWQKFWIKFGYVSALILAGGVVLKLLKRW